MFSSVIFICKFHAKYGTHNALTIYGHCKATRRVFNKREDGGCFTCSFNLMTFPLLLWTFMDFVFGQLHLSMLETKLEAVPVDPVSFGHCILSFRRASCVYSD